MTAHHHHLHLGEQSAWDFFVACLMLKRRGRIQIQARERTAATKHDQIRAREEALAATKHLHVIPMARERFSSKISKRGWWRRDIKWGEGRVAPMVRKGTGHGEEEWRERSNRSYLYPRKFVLPVLPVGRRQYYR
jgi:hypothetical protein